MCRLYAQNQYDSLQTNDLEAEIQISKPLESENAFPDETIPEEIPDAVYSEWVLYPDQIDVSNFIKYEPNIPVVNFFDKEKN